MDSAHSSASLQSSSGGDEEYDSRQEPMSAMAGPTIFSGAGSFPNYFRPQQAGFSNLGAGGPMPTTTSSAAAANNSPYRRPASGAGAKKRSRASRRAPTTVLTTDTSNFRAMVQEFTGIPTPPFSTTSSSGLPRGRLDLFSGVSPSPYPLLLRPKPGLPNMATNLAGATPRIGNLLNMGSSLLPLQSLIMQPPPITPPNYPLLAHKSQLSSHPSAGVDLTMGLLDDITATQSLVGNANTMSAAAKMKFASNLVDDQLIINPQKDQEQSTNVLSSRQGEGMLDYSWICSSD